MMYSTEYCEVKYEENYNVVFVKWKRFCSYDDYRKPLEYALEMLWYFYLWFLYGIRNAVYYFGRMESK